MLGFAKLLQTLFAKFTATSTELKATERSCIIIRERIVNPESARLNLLEEALGFKGIISIEVGSQTILGIIRQPANLAPSKIFFL